MLGYLLTVALASSSDTASWADTTFSSSSSGSGGLPAHITAALPGSWPAGLLQRLCKANSFAEAEFFIMSNGTAFFNNSLDFGQEARDMLSSTKEAGLFFTGLCLSECPPLTAPDFKLQCTEGAHEFRTTFRSKTTQHATMQYEVLFVIFWILCGAFFRRFLPPSVPYTVGILSIGLLLGVIAEMVEQDPRCPHNIMLHDKDHDGKVSQEEYDSFTCVGCDPESFCLSSQRIHVWALGARTCGDGSADAPGCPFSFASLDSGWKKSKMHPEEVTSVANNGYLEANELWRRDCNALRDMLSLSDMDPHYLLVIFLPLLLFESACFGLDIGIFKKQKFQILLLAFPAMIVASGITGALLYAHNLLMQTHWTVWHCCKPT
jgi:hypothetical protein